MKKVLICILIVFGFNLITEAQLQKHTSEAESAELIGGASKVVDDVASGGYLISLTKPGDGLKFTDLQTQSKLAIRYASENVGSISVVVNNQPVRKVNIHSSGEFTGSFLYSVARNGNLE